MQAGEMRHRVEIWRAAKTKVDGFTKAEYQPLKKVWAKANGLYGTEARDAEDYEASHTVIFTMRYKACPDLTARDRLLFRGKIYNIRNVDNILFQNAWLKITAVAEEA